MPHELALERPQVVMAERQVVGQIGGAAMNAGVSISPRQPFMRLPASAAIDRRSSRSLSSSSTSVVDIDDPLDPSVGRTV
jgi:hypothetical protein